ncbi:MAG: hypothetical protein ACUVQ4_00725 [bacterium]
MLRMKKIVFSLSLGCLLLFSYQTDSTGVPMRDGIRLGTDIYRPW